MVLLLKGLGGGVGFIFFHSNRLFFSIVKCDGPVFSDVSVLKVYVLWELDEHI